ncbi:hypothetical protein RLDS_17080 [Sphingobium lactosutens DS20]|uniref:Uncharacterized protein n=1 Tax=Sphingobium lactosutens DS20 TaxID=1331060 RepID=T0HJ15_9SPHN|nr:hypothetical protein RLDS_17080 [Sphingobium lactosutens DS20]
MLNEWSDRDPDPPRSAWRDRIIMALAALTGITLLVNIAQRFGLLYRANPIERAQRQSRRRAHPVGILTIDRRHGLACGEQK